MRRRRGEVQFVLSPVAGRVAALPVAAGQPVSLGGTVAVVIPEGARLEAELLAPSSAAGFIRPGQDTRLMLQAFPHQRFGTVKGAIKTISRTVLGPTEISIPGLKIDEPVFRVRVTLEREDIAAYGEAIPLQPGMLLTADVVFNQRSLIRWFVRSPVRGGTTVMNLLQSIREELAPTDVRRGTSPHRPNLFSGVCPASANPLPLAPLTREALVSLADAGAFPPLRGASITTNANLMDLAACRGPIALR